MTPSNRRSFDDNSESEEEDDGDDQGVFCGWYIYVCVWVCVMYAITHIMHAPPTRPDEITVEQSLALLRKKRSRLSVDNETSGTLCMK